MNDKTGGPAFPNGLCDPTSGAYHIVDGMTLRDYFVAKAMQGLLSNPTIDNEKGGVQFGGDFPQNNARLARVCGYIADAMLKEREK